MAALMRVGQDPATVSPFGPEWTEGEIEALIGVRLQQKVVRTPAGDYRMFFQQRGLLNATASLVLGEAVLGDALLLPPGEPLE